MGHFLSLGLVLDKLSLTFPLALLLLLSFLNFGNLFVQLQLVVPDHVDVLKDAFQLLYLLLSSSAELVLSAEGELEQLNHHVLSKSANSIPHLHVHLNFLLVIENGLELSFVYFTQT